MKTWQDENEVKNDLETVAQYLRKNFKKATSYDDVYEKYEKWGEKAHNEMMKGKNKEKTQYNWGCLETIIALCEFLNASSTEGMADKIEEEGFAKNFADYQKNKIFDRNLQERPE